MKYIYLILLFFFSQNLEAQDADYEQVSFVGNKINPAMAGNTPGIRAAFFSKKQFGSEVRSSVNSHLLVFDWDVTEKWGLGIRAEQDNNFFEKSTLGAAVSYTGIETKNYFVDFGLSIDYQYYGLNKTESDFLFGDQVTHYSDQISATKDFVQDQLINLNANHLAAISGGVLFKHKHFWLGGAFSNVLSTEATQSVPLIPTKYTLHGGLILDSETDNGFFFWPTFIIEKQAESWYGQTIANFTVSEIFSGGVGFRYVSFHKSMLARVGFQIGESFCFNFDSNWIVSGKGEKFQGTYGISLIFEKSKSSKKRHFGLMNPIYDKNDGTKRR